MEGKEIADQLCPNGHFFLSPPYKGKFHVSNDKLTKRQKYYELKLHSINNKGKLENLNSAILFSLHALNIFLAH